MPDCHLFLYEELLAYDHLTSNGIVILNLHTDGDLRSTVRGGTVGRAEELADIVRHYNPQPQVRQHHGEAVVRSNLTKEQYSQMVRDAKEYIRNGDIFQIVLSQRFEISNPRRTALPFTGNSVPLKSVTVSVLFPHTGI